MPDKKRRWKDIPLEERDRLLATYEAHGAIDPALQPALNINMSTASLERRLRDHRMYKAAFVDNAALHINMPASPTPTYDKFIEVETDDAIIISDVEIPDHSEQILKAALLAGMANNIKKLIIAGDLIATDQDYLNHWTMTIRDEKEMNYESAIDLVNNALNAMGKWFDEIYIIEGNHDDRIARATGGQVHLGMLLQTEAKVAYSRYGFMWLKTSRGPVWITHPTNFSSNPVTLGQELYDSSPRKGHVVVAHCHRRQDGWTKDGLYEVHALGTCRDPWRTKYKATKANKHRQWDSSLLMIRDGYHYPMDLYATNWKRELGPLAEHLQVPARHT